MLLQQMIRVIYAKIMLTNCVWLQLRRTAFDRSGRFSPLFLRFSIEIAPVFVHFNQKLRKTPRENAPVFVHFNQKWREYSTKWRKFTKEWRGKPVSTVKCSLRGSLRRKARVSLQFFWFNSSFRKLKGITIRCRGSLWVNLPLLAIYHAFAVIR